MATTSTQQVTSAASADAISVCAECGASMVVRAQWQNGIVQALYWSCRRAPGCTGTRKIRQPESIRPIGHDATTQAVFDWEGGTRIGDSLDTFVRRWGRSATCRGSIVVICSDGLDRGDPAVLAAATERLARLSHRVVWLNPHKGHDREFRPSTLGMMVAAPHVDLLLSGHDLRSLEEFAAMLPELG